MRIGVDVDGVVADFDAGWRLAYQQWFDRKVADKANRWEILEETHFPSMNQFWKWTESVPEFWLKFGLIPGAAGALYDLRGSGHDLVLVTNRPEKLRDVTYDWAVHNLGFFDWEIHHVADKTSVDWNVLVDDSPKVLAGVAEAGRTAIRFATAYNGAAGGIAANGWDRVKFILDSMADVFAPIEAQAA